MSRYRVDVLKPGTFEVTHEIVECSSPEQELEQLQKLVGGYIEMLPITFEYEGKIRRTSYVDEDGMSKELKYNTTGTMASGYPILGNLVIVMGAAE